MINEAYIVKNYFKETSVSDQKSNLSLFISSNSLIFCEFTNDFKIITELAEIEFNNHTNPTITLIERVQFIFSNYQLIKNYNKVYIVILNTNFTLIPNAFKTESNNSEILKFVTGITHTRNTIEHSLNNFTFRYTIEYELKQFLEKTFPIAFIRHSGAVILNLFNSLPALTNFDLFLNINYGIIEIAVKQKNDLQFYNVFNYQTNEDIIYYLLFTLEQLNLNPLFVKVAISGQIETSDHLIISLKKYVKQIGFLVLKESAPVKNEKHSFPNHYYFNVLTQHLCEL